MPVIFDRYEQHTHPGMLGIAEFLVSDQLGDAVDQGAADMAAMANATAGITKVRGTYYTEPGPVVIVTKNGNPRLSRRVRSDHPAAAADEFGSGSGAKNGSRKRPQGGGSKPNRTLGRAADRIGDRFGSVDD